MKLSEELEKCHNSGDFGRALAGYAERVRILEYALESAAVIAEREACAKVCEKIALDYAKNNPYSNSEPLMRGCWEKAAKAIRERPIYIET